MVGIETEYGILVEGKGAGDLVDEAAALVRACHFPHVAGWDYLDEHPRRDLRGFTVDHLAIDPVDARFEQAGRPISTDVSLRSDRVLASGARLYNDHGHPEYSTPECTSVRELVAADRAGERILHAIARQQGEATGKQVSLYKNNTDHHGASYGTHESYLIRREPAFDALLAVLLPFLVTRQVFAGAGKVGVERAGAKGVDYQLSQRADHMSVVASVDTLHKRPIVNTRDEPHADPRMFRRLHVICGDANLCETATFLKVGTTLLVARLLETGWRPAGLMPADPVGAFRTISADPTWKWLIPREGRGTIGALEIQSAYLEAARERFHGSSPETDQVLDEWERVLAGLARDPWSLADTCDWVAKRALLEEFRAAEGLDWSDPVLRSLDIAYHDIDPDAGLYGGLEQAGAVRRIVGDDEIEAAMVAPPHGSVRARIRTIAVTRFPEAVRSVNWSRISVETSPGAVRTVSLAPCDTVDPDRLDAMLAGAVAPADFVECVERIARGAAAGED
ncbi:MAG: proteasome accessory factor PafA2 family protein [Armatimonadota bacterium]